MANDFEEYSKEEMKYVYLPFDKIVRQTMLAIIFDFGEGQEQGIPIAHIDMDEFDPEEDTNVAVKVWFATNNGLI